MECIIDYQDPSIQYGCIQNGKLRRTTNNWINSTVITDNGILNGLEGAWVTPYVLDPNNPQVIYLGFQELYKSTDRGDTWTQLTNLNITNEIRSIVIAPSNNQVIYMSDFDGLWKTTDGGVSWSEITNSLPSLSNNNITYIAIKDNDPNTIWITLGGYNNKKVYQSSDGGSSWLDISGGLPSIPVMTIVQNNQNTVEVELYTGTDVGVYQKIGDNNWTAFCTDLPNVVVTELEIFYDQNNSDNSKLWAATFGRGLWSTPLPSLFSAQNPSSFSASAVSQTQIDLSWNINANSDNVVLAYSLDETFGTPTNGITYSEGDNITGGGTLLYLGNASSFSHSTLNSNTPYYYKIWSFDGNEYSSGLITNATTPCGDITNFPYLEGFESGEVPPNCWTSFRGTNNEGDQIDWAVTTNNVKTGTYSAFLRYEDVANVAEDWLVSPKLSIPNSSSASLSYWERDGGYGQQYTSTYKIKVSTSSPTDHASFTDLSTYTETDLTSTYTQNTIDLSAYIGQEIYVAFVVAQDNGEDWYLDDIKFEVIENSNCTTTYGVDTQIACDSYTWIDGNTYTSNITPALNTNHLVETEGMTFSPSSINIIVGDTVTFVNTGGSHNVNGTTASFPNNPESFGNAVSAGWTFTHVFNTAGNYDYWCDPHSPSMAGVINVSSPNNITYTLINSEGCDSVVTLDLTINSSPIINIGNDTTICDNASITLDAGGGFTTYQWSDGSSNQNLSVSTSGTFSITVTDNNNCSGSSSIVISTINCNANCDAPTNLNASNITTNSANLSWLAGGAETVWELTWGNQGFNTGTGTLVPMLTNDSYNLTGLSANTSYDFYVKADCGFPSGTTDLSSWSGPFSFATSSAVGDDFTAITDQNFEQSLIDLGYDDVINGQVLTSNISNVSYLDVNNQDISSLEGIESFTSLITLICNNNLLTSLDVTQNTALENINCRYNQISTLDVSQNTALISLICNDNILTSLDVSQNIALEHLGCEDNELTSIDVSMNISLIYFICGDNQIATLDVSNNTALTYLGCHANQLTVLDVSQNTALTVLSFGDNQLTSIDVSNLSVLTRFWCYGNSLTCLNLKNGNNTNISSFDATGNSSLNCIEVDNPTWAETNWTQLNLNVDNGITFSTSCSYPAGCF
jgi:plastocyanin